MTDTKRSTGRTTRMILKAYDYVLKHGGDRSVTVVGANVEHCKYLHGLIKDIVQTSYVSNFNMMTYDTWVSRGQGRVESTFVDHFCYENELHNLRNNIENLQSRLANVEKWSSLYDLEP